MWFDNWWGIARIVVAGVAAYAFLVVLLRTSGKRTLSKLNAFDLVVTVAMGSTLASVVLSKQTPVAEGLAAFIVLVACQYAVAKLSVRQRGFARLVRAEPRLVLHHGRLLDDALDAERLTRADVLAVLRQQGIASIEGVGAVVLETDGSLSVLRELPRGDASTLDDVRR
ncbi:DUF421 domain-containing protein [Ramlibacter sp. USB13]|uniref:DUF421 domain-containing protein n=1 Tax=Ramlibacter cellulosilyticus TaxID=2764187 RepID=A0A923MUD9_9BURK|nr:YetF domain-containing protein [Ramlibacter cellulosilyticus]MBC5785438.1 DUF421 domain-containing protein [Ramlibacter cellulosilyticus]